MANLNGVTIEINQARFNRIYSDLENNLKASLTNVTNSLLATSTDTAPIDKGTLRGKGVAKVSGTGNKLKGTVSFNVNENGVNYAILMHENTYNLGESSLAASGGTGMSGTNYPVGNKYLTRVLLGEKETYIKYIERKIGEAL